MSEKLYIRDQIKDAVWLKDQYDKLYDQVKGGKQTVCYVDYNPWGTDHVYRDICTIRPETMEFTSRGHGYGTAKFMSGNEKELFIQLCESIHVEWLREGTAPADIKQINREWICDILIEFTIAYIKSTNKDIANDASEYLYDKLKDAGIVYVLSEEESAAAGREEDFTEAEADFMRECNLYPTSNGVTILTENDEGASIDTDDIIKLAAILKRYVTTFKQNRNNANS